MADKDTRTYIRVHDGMPDHPKIDALSDGAFRLLVSGWCYCSRYLTDGRIPEKVWSRKGNRRSRDELIREGLVHLDSATGDATFHDYLDHQRSAQEVADLRESRREAGSLGGKARSKNLASAKANAKQELKQMGSKPVPETETETEVLTNVSTLAPRGDAKIPRATSRGTRIPEPFTVDEAMKEWALERGMQPQWVMRQTERFVNYWTALAGAKGVKTDWRATWRNWLLKAQDDAPAATSPASRNGYAKDDVRARLFQ
jgi:hypothetical protein